MNLLLYILLVFLTYKAAGVLFKERRFKMLSILPLLLSPFLINWLFFSNTPANADHALIFDNIGIINGVNTSRGQGLESRWPLMTEKVLFNKSHYIFASFLNWLSNMQMEFFFTDIFSRILIIPFMAGLIFIIKSPYKKLWLLPALFIVTTLPFFFSLDFPPEIFIFLLPILSIIIGIGLISFKQWIMVLVVVFVLLDLLLTFTYVQK